MSTYQNIFTIFQFVACKIIGLVFICVFWLFFLVSRMLFFSICMRENCVAISLSYRVGKKKSFAALFRFQYKRHSLSRVFFFVAWLVQRLTEHKLKKILWTFFRMLPRLITINLKCFIEIKLAQKRN